MAFKGPGLGEVIGNLRERMMDRLFGDIISERVYNAIQVVDDEYWSQIRGGAPTLDEDWNARKENLDDALDAWRSNPLARRIVSLCTDYVVGPGIVLRSEVEWVQKFVAEFWSLNRMHERMYDWCDELTRAGELFVVVRTDPVSGASFVRSMPAVWIDQVETDVDDYERETQYHQSAVALQNAQGAVASGSRVDDGLGGRWWAAASEDQVNTEQVMLHYTINRPVGCVRGSSDLQPLLPWLRRYRDWLENRVRLNKFKTAFLWDVTVQGRPGQAEALRKKRFRYKTPPEPGSIIVHDDAETWNAVSPKIEAWDASADGKAIRLMVAAGAGIPLHFLAEGESATKATAAEMGDPTYRHYYRRQLMFGEMLKRLITVAIRRANARGRGRAYADLRLQCKFPDITKHDNLQLAQSASWIARALESYARLGIVDKTTAMEMALRFAGELVDVEAVKRRIAEEGPLARVGLASPPKARSAVAEGARCSSDGGQ
jgi:hypothetical protein